MREIPEIIDDIKRWVNSGRWHTANWADYNYTPNKLKRELLEAIGNSESANLLNEFNTKANQASDQASKHHDWVMSSSVGVALGAMGGGLGLPNAKWPGLGVPNADALQLMGLVFTGVVLGALVMGGSSYLAGKYLGSRKAELAEYPESVEFESICERISADKSSTLTIN